MKKKTNVITASLLLGFSLMLLSCASVTGEEYETVMGTDIPVSELRKNEAISAAMFNAATEGKYYQIIEYYCQWKGNTLRYLQTDEDYYHLQGRYLKDGEAGNIDEASWYYQFEDPIVHEYNTGNRMEVRYALNYDEGTMVTPVKSDTELHSCKVLYVDEKNILAETDVYRPKRMSREARRAASAADFVLLRFVVVTPKKGFFETDWEVRDFTHE